MRREGTDRGMRSTNRAGMLCSLLAVAGLVAIVAGLSAARAGRATAAASAPPIVVRDLRFLGFNKDVVGRGWDAKPNGERDAHFSVVLATPEGARSWGGDLMLLVCPSGTDPSAWRPGVDKFQRGVPTGKCSSSKDPKLGGGDFPEGFASTRRGVPVYEATGFIVRDTAAVVAVFRNGKRLNINPRNTKTWLQLPRSAKGVRLDLYVNDGPRCVKAPGTAPPDECVPRKRIDHRFAAAQEFRLRIENAADRYYSAWLTLPGQVATPSTAIMLSNFSFHGFDKDVIGNTPSSPPDGKPDGHFSIELTTPTAPIDLVDVELGGLAASRGTVAVLLNDTQLKLDNSAFEPPQWVDLRWSTTPVRLDLYASDNNSGAFAPGQRWRVTIRGQGFFVALSDWLTIPGS